MIASMTAILHREPKTNHPRGQEWPLRKVLRILLVLIWPFVITVEAPLSAHADLEWKTKKEVVIESTPLDVATSLDGQMIFILVPKQVIVYSAAAEEIARIDVEGDFDRLTYSIKDNVLILTSSSGKQIKILELEMVYEIPISGLPFKGTENAPVTVAVFSDYQCPYCTRLASQLDKLLEKYPQDVKLVFKNFPLGMHKSAKQAAAAALAANEQGKFWEFHNKLFENYKDLSDEKIQEIAKELALDMEEFNRDIANESIQELIARDVKDAQRVGARGTPTVFVNGKNVKRPSLTTLEEMVKAELEEQKQTNLEISEPSDDAS
ncbi:MAG: hypothetical protein C4532_00850 [Candidatus Abyssobacteria bacterium SURF_17]|jgi:protein-disulfide isomerase|uniref:Thioredoxin domain-containing protein n=1 Tax=Candidatus Abyssobacteria bacterium SURF_17 TaxID=2093361 RepID=A0A419F932_9BACT|nr:MAG: hypothetical protein C4532_00850 [Candidatus Abyssubacteria bacterium SURF_17]